MESIEFSKKLKCIYCNSFEIVKNGKDQNGNQRLKCLNSQCGKSFTEKSIKHFKIRRIKRLVIHLLLLGYDETAIATELNIQIGDVKLWSDKYLPKLKDLINSGKLLEIYHSKNYLSALDKGKRPERVNNNKSKLKPKESTRKH